MNSVLRTKLVPVLVLVLGLAVIAAIALLQQSASASRDAELRLANLKTELQRLQGVPFRASPTTGGSPEVAARQMRTGKGRIDAALDELGNESPPPALEAVRRPLRANFQLLDAIYAIGASGREYGRAADRLAGRAARSEAVIRGLLDAAAREYGSRASRAQRRATIGSALAILLLLGAFALFYRRAVRARSAAERLMRENEALLVASRREALTDALTGLRNRRALMDDLERELGSAPGGRRLALAMYDLDGFKLYNDSFGHPAGDALLIRLAERLQDCVGASGSTYRMGGDEFCALVPADADDGDAVLQRAADALSERGEAFEIGCSYGVALLPGEASTPAEALRLADQRLYGNKAGRSSASRQSTDVLLKVLSERSPGLSEHLSGVARLAEAAARRLALPEHEVKRVRLAAELHDVGKTAIPDAILNKPDKLDDREWEFIRRHTLIGERIVSAAPSLTHTGELIRSSHEHYDGGGYPDGLRGDDIPLGASIIAACDAFDAMVSERPYRAALSTDEALAELRRCAGRQFHPDVVAALRAVVEEAGMPAQAVA